MQHDVNVAGFGLQRTPYDVPARMRINDETTSFSLRVRYFGRQDWMKDLAINADEAHLRGKMPGGGRRENRVFGVRLVIYLNLFETTKVSKLSAIQ